MHFDVLLSLMLYLSKSKSVTPFSQVLKCCQERLLQCATPDSVTRLRSTRLRSQAGDLWTTYFREQEHSSLANFLDKALSDVKSRSTGNTKIALRAQVRVLTCITFY